MKLFYFTGISKQLLECYLCSIQNRSMLPLFNPKPCLNLTSVLWDQEDNWKLKDKINGWKDSSLNLMLTLCCNRMECYFCKWNEMLKMQLKSNSCLEIAFKDEDEIYAKCNVYRSVSIEGGPDFVVNISIL